MEHIESNEVWFSSIVEKAEKKGISGRNATKIRCYLELVPMIVKKDPV